MCLNASAEVNDTSVHSMDVSQCVSAQVNGTSVHNMDVSQRVSAEVNGTSVRAVSQLPQSSSRFPPSQNPQTPNAKLGSCSTSRVGHQFTSSG